MTNVRRRDSSHALYGSLTVELCLFYTATAVSQMDERTIPGQGVKRTRPCAQCRLRKIKCDKQRPCESCRRSDIDCIYDGSHPESNVESRSELLDRVDHLEAQLQAVTSILRAKGAGPSVATVVPDEAPSLPECSCGRQILGTHFSIHYDYYMNWVELFPKVSEGSLGIRNCT